MKLLRLFSLLMILSFFLSSTGSVYAETADVTLVFNPAAVGLYPGGETEVILTITNNTDRVISNLELKISGIPGINSLYQALPGKIQAKSKALVPIKITNQDKPFDNGNLQFQLNYKVEKSTDSPEKEDSVFASLAVACKTIQAIDTLITATSSTPLTYLGEKHTGIVTVTVRNISQFPLTITSVEPGGAQYVAISPDAYTETHILAPQNSILFQFQVNLDGTYETITETLYFTVFLEWNQAEQTFSGNKIVTQTLPIGMIAGESDLLKLLGIPSLVIIPGFLMVVVFAYLLKKFIIKFDLEFTPTTPILWILAVTLSIIAIFIYRAITLAQENPRFFPNSYSLLDVITLWLYSVAIGILIWLICVVVKLVKNRLKLPKGDEDPIQILQKLTWQNKGVYLDQVKYKESSSFFRFPVDDGANTWIIPPIVIKPLDRNSATIKRIRSILDRDEEGDTRGFTTKKGTVDLYWAIWWGRVQNKITVGWKKGDRPIKVAPADFVKIREGLLVEIDSE